MLGRGMADVTLNPQEPDRMTLVDVKLGNRRPDDGLGIPYVNQLTDDDIGDAQ
jgi:hypothetical protein